MTTLTLTTQAEAATAARSQLYALLASGFRFPSPVLHTEIRDGRFLAAVETAARALPYRLDPAEVPGRGAPQLFEEFEREYIALFDVGGPGGAPCLLYEGEHSGARLKVLEDVLRFYHYFGLHLAEKRNRRDRPDHLATELEFLHALTFTEASRLAAGKDPGPFRRAQHDFLRFHAAEVVSRVAATVGPRQVRFYSALASFGERFCQAELTCLAGS